MNLHCIFMLYVVFGKQIFHVLGLRVAQFLQFAQLLVHFEERPLDGLQLIIGAIEFNPRHPEFLLADNRFVGHV